MSMRIKELTAQLAWVSAPHVRMQQREAYALDGQLSLFDGPEVSELPGRKEEEAEERQTRVATTHKGKSQTHDS